MLTNNMKMSYWAEQHITPLLGMLGDEVIHHAPQQVADGVADGGEGSVEKSVK